MTRAAAIAAREYASMFRVPLGWIVIALFLFLSGALFAARGLVPGQPATMRPFFEMWWILLLVLAPAVSMRLLSEERRSGTLETLLTAPVHEITVVVGKYAAAVLFLLTLLLPTLVYAVVLRALARIDLGPIAAGYAGIVLLGMFYLAVGCLVSSLTSNQTLAFLGTLFALGAMELVAAAVAPLAPAWVAAAVPWSSLGASDDFARRAADSAGDLCRAFSANLRMADFARGIIASSHVAFFLAGAAWFLTAAALALQSRRWR